MVGIPCRFHSEWDGGYLVTSAAKVDPETGAIFDIEIVNADHETLDREFITLEGNDTEFEISEIDEGPYQVGDLEAFKAAAGHIEMTRHCP